LNINISRAAEDAKRDDRVRQAAKYSELDEEIYERQEKLK